MLAGGGEGLADLNVAVFDGAERSLGDVLAAAEQVPWSGGRRLVVARDLALLRPPSGASDATAGGEGADGDVAALERYLAAPAAHTVLVFVAPAVDRRRAAARLLLQRAAVVECQAPPERDLPGWIVREVARRGGQIENRAALMLAQRVGRNLMRLDRELDKLMAHAEGGVIGAAAVEALVPAAAEVRVFDLLDALGDGDPGAALAAARRLMDAGENPVGLLALLARHVRRVLETGLRLERGATPADIQQRLGVHPYVARKLAAQARRLASRALEDVLLAIHDADEAVKTGRLSGEAAVERVVILLGSAVRTPSAG